MGVVRNEIMMRVFVNVVSKFFLELSTYCSMLCGSHKFYFKNYAFLFLQKITEKLLVFDIKTTSRLQYLVRILREHYAVIQISS